MTIILLAMSCPQEMTCGCIYAACGLVVIAKDYIPPSFCMCTLLITFLMTYSANICQPIEFNGGPRADTSIGWTQQCTLQLWQVLDK